MPLMKIPRDEIKIKFERCVQFIQSLPPASEDPSVQPSNAEKLRFYALYKQATVGPCSENKKPSFWDVVARAKWDAWWAVRNLSVDDAMAEYCDELVRYLKRFPDRPMAMDMLHSLQDENSKKKMLKYESIQEEPSASELNLTDRIKKLESRLSLSAAMISPSSSSSLQSDNSALLSPRVGRARILSAVQINHELQAKLVDDESNRKSFWHRLLLFLGRKKSLLLAICVALAVLLYSSEKRKQEWRVWLQELQNRAMMLALTAAQRLSS